MSELYEAAICMNFHTHTHTRDLHTRAFTDTRVHASIRTRAHANIRTRSHAHTRAFAHAHTRTRAQLSYPRHMHTTNHFYISINCSLSVYLSHYRCTYFQPMLKLKICYGDINMPSLSLIFA